MAPVRVRDLAAVRAAGDEPWFRAGLDALRLPRASGATWAASFEARAPVFVARAPGRLDVMGGIADYSGARVLEMPLRHSTYAVVQRQHRPVVDVVSARGAVDHAFTVDVARLVTGDLRRAADLRAWFAGRDDDRWAAYVIGVVAACLAREPRDPGGLRIRIASEVPEGSGVSSSAALEVAVLCAVAAAWDLALAAEDVARAAQWAENEVAGAPCGIMDQVTSSCGEQDRLLSLLCQPAIIGGHLAVPPSWRFLGIDSGIRHAVTGADYATVRTAAFMGYRIIADRLGFDVRHEDRGRVRVDDRRFGGYVANIGPGEFLRDHADRLPDAMHGAEFLARFGGITDAVTRVDPGCTYPVRQATMHPVMEHDRVTRFASLLEALTLRPELATDMGRLMRESHASYSACGLGSAGTDRLVELVEEAGPARGLFGAKITGGGSGGTVAVLAHADAEPAVREVAARYARETGRPAEVLAGSGPGAIATGVLCLEPTALSG